MTADSHIRESKNLFLIFILTCILTVTIATPSAQTATSVLLLNHRAYEFLERMKNLGIAPRFILGTKPLTRQEIADVIADILSDKESLPRLSSVEMAELDFLVKEFVEELSLLLPENTYVKRARLPRLGWWWKPEAFPGLFYDNDRNFLRIERPTYTLYLDPILVMNTRIVGADSVDQRENIYLKSSGFRFYGTIGSHLGFDFDTRDSREWGDRVYPDQPGIIREGLGWVHAKKTYMDFDETVAHITLNLNRFIFQYGKGENIWGNGRMGTLSLSGAPTSYDLIRMSVSFSKIRFTHVVGFLKQVPAISVRSYFSAEGDTLGNVEEKKYLAAHRLEFNPMDWLSVGLYETIVFGGRFEFGYLNPVMFLKSAEHYLGDHDNATMGIDTNIRLRRGLSVYGELFIDDITTNKIGTGWYGNKLGFQTGGYWIHPFGFRDTDLRLQYTRIQPYVYTNRIPINVYHHYGTVLGHHIGPNSDEVLLSLNVRPSRRITGNCIVRFRRHGANPTGKNVGGDINLPFSKKTDSSKVHFLDGDVENHFFLNLTVSYEFFRNAFISAGVSFEQYKGVQNLPDGDNTMLYMSIGLNE